MTHTNEPIHQSSLTPAEWAERLRTENPVGQVTRLLQRMDAEAEASKAGHGK